MTVAFKLDGQSFTALNGGSTFKFNEAVSFVVNCETQEEIDYYWSKLSAGGDPKAQQCGGRVAGDASGPRAAHFATKNVATSAANAIACRITL